MKPRLLILYDPGPEARARLDLVFAIEHLPEAELVADYVADRGPGIAAVATSGFVGLAAPVMAALPDLRIISNYGVGYDNLDAKAAAKRGIVVTHTPDVLNDDVANTAILLWMATARRLVVQDAYLRAGRWRSDGPAALTDTTDGRTVGIVGLGRIGHAIADRLAVFNSKVVYHSRNPRDVPYRYYSDPVAMARDCDVLIVAVPGGPDTQHLVDSDVLDALGPSGMLVNIARGSVVDEAALIAALQSGRLGAAGLDVFADEPNVPQALIEMENVTLLPHVGSATKETRKAMADLTCDNLLRFFRDGQVYTPVPECAHLALRARR